MVTDKETKAAAGPALAAKPSIEKELGDAKATAQEIGIEVGHVAGLKGADKMFAYASASPISIDEEMNKRLVRKIDWHILPWLCLLYVLQYGLRRISYAGVMGIQTETGLSSSQFTWLGSIYYAGYIVAAPVHNRMFQAYPPSKWIACCVVAWGIVLSCMAACENFAGLMVQRTLLGALEASINCGFSLITAAWYRKYEHGTRTGIWSSCTGFANMIGGLIAFGCVSGQAKHPSALSSWKILSLITGLVSIIFGTCMWLFMAASAVEARFFTEDEKTLAVERLRDNHQGAGSTQYKRYQAKEALLDCRTWMYTVFVLSSQIPAAGLILLQSILIKSLGFTTKETLLLNIPQGFITILCNLSFGSLADITKQRSGSAIAAGVFSLFWAALYMGFFMSGSCSTSWFVVISMMSSNVLGTTKKTTVNSVVFLILGVAYFVGPQTFRDAPYYAHAKTSLIVLWTVSILVLAAFYMLNRRENGQRDETQGERRDADERGTGNIEFMDLTDKENKLFRYVL